MKNLTRYRITEVLRLFSDSVLPIIFWVSLIFGFDTPYVAFLTLIAAFAHEMGHCAAIWMLSGEGARVRGHSSGLRIRRGEALSYRSEIAILLAGPAVNISLFLLALPFGSSLCGYVRVFGLVNLATGLSNLLPFEGYDGYGAICEALCAMGRADMIKRLEVLSFVLSICLTFISLYLIGRFGEGYWIFGVFFVMMLSKIVSYGKYDIFGE